MELPVVSILKKIDYAQFEYRKLWKLYIIVSP